METNERKMAFLAHWVESWNWLLWPFSCLHRHPEWRYWFFWLYPMCWVMSVKYLVGKKPFDTVDRFVFKTPAGEEIDCRTVLLRNFGWHFFLPTRRNGIKKRILDAVLELQRKGVKVIGLGALIKDIRITDGGSWIVKELSDRLWAWIVHGDTLTAATVIRQALALIEKYQIKGPVFLTGSTSKIGRAVAIDLARRGVRVLMYTQDLERFQSIAKEAGDCSDKLEWTNSLSWGSSCQLWITGKAIPSRRDLYKHIPDDAVVLNFAVPNPLKKRDFRARPDIKHFEGGLLAYDPQKVDIHFTMRLKPGITYACHAGTFIHSFKEWQFHEVGPVDLQRLDETWRAAEEIGFFLPPVN